MSFVAAGNSVLHFTLQPKTTTVFRSAGEHNATAFSRPASQELRTAMMAETYGKSGGWLDGSAQGVVGWLQV